MVAAAQGDQGRQQVIWDFTTPETLHEHAQWLRNDGIAASENGLSWDLQAGEQPETWAQRTIHLRSRQPVPVGWSWRPATEVRIEAEIEPADAFRLLPRKWLYGGETGILYVRYSAEGRNWSSWHPLILQRPPDGGHAAVVLTGALSVPEVAQQSYRELLREAPRKPVTRLHVGRDQEAAVEWIVDRQPDFFAREFPFIGYVEFLWEVQLRPQQQIKQLKIDISYPRPMRVEPPAGHDWTKSWRFRLEDAADQASSRPDDQNAASDAFERRLASILRDIQTLHVGMTREDLLKKFRPEGGLSTRLQRRYASRESRYIKIDVKFEPVGAPEDKLAEAPEDRIIEISMPFLQWSIID